MKLDLGEKLDLYENNGYVGVSCRDRLWSRVLDCSSCLLEASLESTLKDRILVGHRDLLGVTYET
jgi:hypothetical protein